MFDNTLTLLVSNTTMIVIAEMDAAAVATQGNDRIRYQ
jgi:hypothetical protein